MCIYAQVCIPVCIIYAYTYMYRVLRILEKKTIFNRIMSVSIKLSADTSLGPLSVGIPRMSIVPSEDGSPLPFVITCLRGDHIN